MDGTLGKTKLTKWRSDSNLASGLHTKDLELPAAELFRPASTDIVVAEADAGPIIVARPGAHKIAVLGFQPSKYELTTPLLFANLVRWMAPDVFTTYELTAGTVGHGERATWNPKPSRPAIRVMTENQPRLPFTLEGQNLRFFAAAPGIVRISTGGREIVYSLTLPQAGDRGLEARRSPHRHSAPHPLLRPLPAISGSGWPCWARSAYWLRLVPVRARRPRPQCGDNRRRVPAALAESLMTFDRAWVLPFALLPLLWMLWELRRTRRRAPLILKGLAFCAIALGIGRAAAHHQRIQMAVAVLVDTSASVGEEDLARAPSLPLRSKRAAAVTWSA